MARGFTKEEREKIKELLIKKGKSLFLQYGFQKTSITQITKAVGISQGSFYIFFTSKEELYFHILEKEEKHFQNMLLNVSFNEDELPQTVLKRLLKNILQQLRSNRLMKDLYLGDQFIRLRQRLSKHSLENHFRDDQEFFQTMMTEWEKQGLTFKVSPDVFAASFRSLFIISLQKEAIGEDVFEETIDLLVSGVVNEVVQQ